jgi:hypothetical protein
MVYAMSNIFYYLNTQVAHDIIPYQQKGIGRWFATTRNGKTHFIGLISY